ncbi:hypothetical protein C9374_004388 [Naegleria lovaniensis]|uniref:TM2 domain-containing protein n=1 Tax=Naegleria lovaniensis TaxID=51637 RepID=A0AA88KK18_NAELO|nr:uncharacterized protein C9374_004388 [Naegleria lovaniensis]KAG2383717.1 hypothetical protein C9374_004388 [Naegleria lovaniensis]
MNPMKNGGGSSRRTVLGGSSFLEFVLHVSLALLCILLRVVNAQTPSLVITNNRLTSRGFTGKILTATDLSASLSSSTSGITLIIVNFFILNMKGGHFEYLNGNASLFVNSFTSNDIQQGKVLFIPDGYVGSTSSTNSPIEYPAYNVIAQGTIQTASGTSVLNSTLSTAQVTYSRWSEPALPLTWTSISTSAPKPIVINRSNTTHAYFEVTMFKRNLALDGLPASSFHVALQSDSLCQTSSNIVLNALSDGFVLVKDSSYSQTFVLVRTLRDHLSDSKVVKNMAGVYIDAKTTIFTSYMLYDPTVGTLTCKTISFTEVIITQVDLSLQPIPSTSNPDISLTPTRLVVSDSSQIEVGLSVRIAGLNNANIFNWNVIGPKHFGVKYPILIDVKSDAKYWKVSLASNKVNPGDDYSGTYKVSFESQLSGQPGSTLYELSFSLQYVVPNNDNAGNGGNGGLNFDTQIDTYLDNNFATSPPQTQFYKDNLMFVKVSTIIVQTSVGGLSPIPSSKQVAPWNVFICCTKNLQAIPSNQCRQFDSSIMTYQKQLVINGTVSNDTDVRYGFNFTYPEDILGISDWGTLRHIYAFSLFLDPLLTGQDKRCFFAADTYLVNADLPILTSLSKRNSASISKPSRRKLSIQYGASSRKHIEITLSDSMANDRKYVRSLQAVAASSNMISTSTRAFDLLERVAPRGSSSKSVIKSPVPSTKVQLPSIQYICDSFAMPSKPLHLQHWVMTIVTSCCIGLCGIHRFYLDSVLLGIISLLTGGIFGILQLVDLCLIPGMVATLNAKEQGTTKVVVVQQTQPVAQPPPTQVVVVNNNTNVNN